MGVLVAQLLLFFVFAHRLYPLRELFNRPDVLFDDFNGVLTSLVNPSPQARAPKVDKNLVDEVTG